jgi:hypothetical protein
MEVIKRKNNFFSINELAREFRTNVKTVYWRLWAKQDPGLQGGKDLEDFKEEYCLVEEIIFVCDFFCPVKSSAL